MPQLEFSMWIIKLSIKWSMFTLMFVSLKFSKFHKINLIKANFLKNKNLLMKWKWK